MGTRWRAAGLLLIVAGLTLPVLAMAVPLLTGPVRDVAGEVSRLLAVLLLCSWGWLSLTTAALAVELAATGAALRSGRHAPAFVRALVAVACGTGLAAGFVGPAVADTGQSTPEVHVLDGLPLPDRALGRPVTPRAVAAPAPKVTVEPGDSLWSIARTHDTDWPTLYAANRAAVGDDPDLIQPGIELVLPRRTQGADR